MVGHGDLKIDTLTLVSRPYIGELFRLNQTWYAGYALSMINAWLLPITGYQW
jgi:hypothetical protein